MAQWSVLQRVFATVGSSVIVLLFAALAYAGTVREQRSQLQADHSDKIIRTLDIALARLADAETGQRGYLLTGDERYLSPYAAAERDVELYLARLDTLTIGDAPQYARLDTLANLSRTKFTELEGTVTLRRASGFDAALEVVDTDHGKQVMDDFRRVAGDMKLAETRRLHARVEREERYSQLVRWILVVGSLVAVVAALIANSLLSHYARAQEKAAHDLDEQNTRLREQSLELELQNQQLHEQALEMELQQQHLQEQTSELEAQTEQLAQANIGLAASAEERRLGEERLRLALSAGRLGSWEWNIATGKVLWTPEVERMHGLEAASFPGTFEAFQSDIHPDDRERVLGAIQAVVYGNEHHELVYRIIRTDGEVRWLETHGQLIADDAGHPAKLVGVCVDVTDWKRADDDLRFIASASDTLARSLDYDTTLATVARLPVPALADVCVVDIVANGTLQRLSAAYANERHAALLEELREDSGVKLPTAHQRSEVLRTGKSILLEVIPGGAHASDAHGGTRADGVPVPRSCMVVPLGAPSAGLGVMTFITGESGRHYTSADLALAEDVAHRAALAIDRARLHTDLAASREEVEEQAAELEMSNEELESANQRLHDVNDALKSAMGERETEQAAAVAARSQAEAANEAKSEFLATMSHELRTPLNAIAGYVDLLSLEIRGPITKDQRDDLDRIRKNGRYLLALINDILNFARLEAGHVQFSTSALSVRDLMVGVEPLVAPQLAGCGIRYECPPCEPDMFVVADPERTQQILLNLLTNAIKFTEQGGSITVTSGDSGEVAWLRVADTGRGIAPEKLERIFEPFVQVDRHLTNVSQQGVGLGLAISRDLARKMGGDITAESALGRGSTFTLSLPRVGAAHAPDRNGVANGGSLAGEVHGAGETTR